MAEHNPATDASAPAPADLDAIALGLVTHMDTSQGLTTPRASLVMLPAVGEGGRGERVRHWAPLAIKVKKKQKKRALYLGAKPRPPEGFIIRHQSKGSKGGFVFGVFRSAALVLDTSLSNVRNDLARKIATDAVAYFGLQAYGGHQRPSDW
jgi:hypothetical protein